MFITIDFLFFMLFIYKYISFHKQFFNLKMTSKWIKYPALQSPENVGDGQLLDFDIGDWEIVDLTRSYVSMKAAIATTDLAGVSAIHAVYQSHKFNTPFNNAVLVGDYDLKNSKLGVVESVQNANIVNGNLQAFERDFEDVDSDNYKTFSQYNGPYLGSLNSTQSPFNRLYRDKDSYNVVSECKIKLSDLSPFCRACSVYDCSKMGRTRLHMRMDRSSLDTVGEYLPYDGFATVTNGGGKNFVGYSAVNRGEAAGTATITDTYTYNYADDLNIKKDDSVIVNYTSGAEARVLVTKVTATPTIAANAISIITKDELPGGGPATVVSFTKIDPKAPVIACDNLAVAGLVITSSVLYTNDDLKYLKKTFTGKHVALIRTETAGPTTIASYYTVAAIAFVGGGNILSNKVTITLVAVAPAATNVPASTGLSLYLIQQPPQALAGLTQANAKSTTVTITGAAAGIATNPLWKGQNIRVFGVQAGGAGINVTGKVLNTSITKIEVAGADIVVTMNDALGFDNTAGGVITLLKLQCGNSITSTLQLTQPQLVLKTLMPKHPNVVNYVKNDLLDINFSTWNLELSNIPTGSLNFKRLFECDPNAKNVYVLAVVRGTEILGFQNYLSSYRMRNNFIDMTNRDINVFGPLHLDQIAQAFSNSGALSLKSVYNYSDNRYSAAPNQSVCMPCAVLPYGQPNRVEVQLNFSNASVANLTLFFIREVAKVITVSKSGVEMS